MLKALFFIGMTSFAFIIGRSIRDLFKKRPVRQKKARRRGIVKLFAAIATLIIALLIITISLVLGVAVFNGDATIEKFILFLIIDGFAVYLFILLLTFLKKY